MPSPFPGMNPYLEQEDAWHNFHEHFCLRCYEALVPQVLNSYLVKIDEHVYIHSLISDERRLLGRGDITVAHPEGKGISGSSAAILEAPVVGDVPMAADIERESLIEIRDRRSRELITIVELLSPANKRPGPDREQYLSKRREILASGVNFVEIDLLRGGPRMPVQGLTQCDYCILVSPAVDRPKVGIWPIRLRDSLPKIPIPLREPGEEARLDLQDLLHHVYDAGGYQTYIYSSEPDPPLNPEDADWAVEIARK